MPREDLSTYTVAGADEATYLTDNTKYRTLAKAMRLGDECYRYKDFGAGHFGDFTHYFEHRFEDLPAGATGRAYPYLMAQVAGDAARAVTSVSKQGAESGDDIGVAKSTPGGVWSAYALNVATVTCGDITTFGSNSLGVGMRFPGLNLPDDATVVSVSLTFKASASLGANDLKSRIRGELDKTGAIFSDFDDYKVRRGISDGGAGNCTATVVDWDFNTAWVAGTLYACSAAGLITMMQEMVDTLGGVTDAVLFWDDHDDRSGNDIRRQAYSWDQAGNISGPTLAVTYYVGSTDNYLAVRQIGTALDLVEFYGGNESNSSADYTMYEGEVVYLKVERSGVTVHLHIYSDPARKHECTGSPLVLTQDAAETYRYFHCMASYDSGITASITCWSGNYWLDGTAPSEYFLTEDLSSFLLVPEDTETFDLLADADLINDADADLTWTLGGANIVATDGAGAGESVSPQGGMSALVNCVAGASYASFVPSDAATQGYEMMPWVKLISIGANESGMLFGTFTAVPSYMMAGVVDVAGTHYWRIWKYSGAGAWSTQTTFTMETGVWYQILLFQEVYDLVSMWVRKYGAVEGEQYYTWTEVETVTGINANVTKCFIGCVSGTPTYKFQIDDIRYQSGFWGMDSIACGTETLITANLNKNGVQVYDLFSSAAITIDPSCWTHRADITPTVGGWLVWDAAHSCWWELETTGALGDNAVCDVYQVDADDWGRNLRSTFDPATAPISDDNLWYIVPSRLIEGGKLLCLVFVAPIAMTSGDCYFITFDTNHGFDHVGVDVNADPASGCWSAPILVCDETDLANYFPCEGFLWRQPEAPNDLVAIIRYAELEDTPAHGAAAANIWNLIFISDDDGATWGAAAYPGGDSGELMESYSGWLNAFVFRTNVWYQAYDARTDGPVGGACKNHISSVAMADAADGAIISQRNWGWGPLGTNWSRGFCFPAGNGSIDAMPGQEEYYTLSVVTYRGIGWYMNVGTGEWVIPVRGGGNIAALIAAGVV